MNEYENIIEQILGQLITYKNQHDMQYIRFYFRGHADREWKLVPKIMRSEYAYARESAIMEQAKKECWSFSRSIVDNIAQMQHYGYPTRFLDFTTDIDVALYFICSEQMDKDGIFYIFTYSERYFSFIDSILISELACLKHKISLLDFSRQMIDKYPEYQDKYYDIREFGAHIMSWIDHGFMIKPTEDEREKLKNTNPRLYNQKGAFYVFGNKTKEPVRTASTLEVPRCVILPEIMDNSDVFGLHHIISVLVPKEAKADILNEVIKKGIDESFIYPDKK